MDFLRRLRRDKGSEHQHLPPGAVPGWDAIDAALAQVYGDVEPRHWGTIVRWSQGGPDPLDGISAYPAAGPPLHWHFVTYGLSELYEKESSDPGVSGWGLELTFRLLRLENESEPPTWPLSLLQHLARYVFKTGNVLEPGDHIDLDAPMGFEETRLCAAALVLDPELGEIETPYGHVAFTQVVGLTLDEYAAAMDWDTASLLALMQERNRLLVTDLRRSSILEDLEIAAEVRERTEREGSSMGGVNVDRLDWALTSEGLQLRIGAVLVDRLARLLLGRTRFGRSFYVAGEGRHLEVTPATESGWHVDDGSRLVVHLTDDAVDRLLDGLRPSAGRYWVAGLEGLEILVEQGLWSRIKAAARSRASADAGGTRRHHERG